MQCAAFLPHVDIVPLPCFECSAARQAGAHALPGRSRRSASHTPQTPFGRWNASAIKLVKLHTQLNQLYSYGGIKGVTIGKMR